MTFDRLSIIFEQKPTCIDRHVIQVHPPKTGGTSISRTLGISDHHYPASRLKQRDLSIWESAFTYGIMRNPWDRIESWWRYHEWAEHDSFTSWAEKGFSSLWQVEDLNTRILCQEDWLEIGGTIELDHIIRFERFEHGFEEMVWKLGIQDKIGLVKHENKNPQQYPLYWTNEAYRKSVDIVGYFADKYGYKFNKIIREFSQSEIDNAVPLKENDPMPFGIQYKDVPMHAVPAGHLFVISKRPQVMVGYPRLAAYIRKHKKRINNWQEEKKRKKKER
jgi:hypothetical protein